MFIKTNLNILPMLSSVEKFLNKFISNKTDLEDLRLSKFTLIT